jgi:hypothetical protein
MAENIKEGHYDAVRQHFLAWFARHLTEVGFTNSKVWRKLWVADWPYRHPRFHGALWPVYLKTRRVLRWIKPRWSLLRGLALQ